MACFHPLKGFVTGENKLTGKNSIVVKPHDTQFIMHGNKAIFDFIDIPCGKCIGCRLEYSRQWANRMMLELEYHDSAYFVTLTYSDDFLPKSPVYDADTGEYLYSSKTLRKSDLSKFIKHVRKHFPNDKIRFFGAGEYGSKTLRPHYHVIIFGLHLDDLKVYKRNFQGDVLYNSEELSDCWSNYVGVRSDGSNYYDRVGHVVIGKVNWETCAYVSRYVTKKMSGSLEDWFTYQNMESPFCLMSRNPGIGYQWYVDHPNLFDYEYINLRVADKGLKFRPPKYFDKLYEVDEPALSWLRGKERGYSFEVQKASIEHETDLSYDEYLYSKEFNLKNRLKALDRSKA